MEAIEEILRKTKYDGETGVISVYVSDLESIHEDFEQLQKENEKLVWSLKNVQSQLIDGGKHSILVNSIEIVLNNK